MGLNKAMFTSDKKNWETPQRLFEKLDTVFHFTLDAAASDSNHKVSTYYTAEDDGLMHEWGGREYFVTHHMVIKKQATGLESAI